MGVQLASEIGAVYGGVREEVPDLTRLHNHHFHLQGAVLFGYYYRALSRSLSLTHTVLWITKCLMSGTVRVCTDIQIPC